MSGATKGIVRIQYSDYYKYFTSAGTTLLLLSYLAVFGYVTATYSFGSETNVSHIILLLVPAGMGVIMGGYGIFLWRSNYQSQNKMQEQEHREQKARAKLAENQAKLFERRAEQMDDDDLSIDDRVIHVQDWD